MTEPKNKPTRIESKAAATDAAARDIIQRDTRSRDEKTSRLRAARLLRDAALDEALDESFPASDPVEIGHSEHAGRSAQKKVSQRPKAKR